MILAAKPCRRAILAFLFLFGVIGVTSIYTRLTMTSDEPFHISCGMEWLIQGTYTAQPLHPPMARVMDALFLDLYNILTHYKAWDHMPHRDAYLDKMALSRLGTLPAYLLSCAIVFGWSRRLFGEASALWSLAFYVSLSSVTAHAGLATTDMTYTGVFLWALVCGIGWLQTPDLKRSALMGLSVGLMVGTKFSGIGQWPAAMGAIFIGQCLFNYKRSVPVLPVGRRHFIYGLLCSLPCAALMLGLIFRFSFGPLIAGFHDAQSLSQHGYGVWLFEELNNHGVWYYFPVVFFFKTPLPFFAATMLGNRRIIRELPDQPLTRLYPLLAALGIMLVSMTSNINLGVRHVLPLYPLLAVPAGYGMAWLWNKGAWQRAAAAALLLWQVAGFIQAHPEHMAYFNILAGDHPEHISPDSDFDWGQDMVLVDEELQHRGIRAAYLCSRRVTYYNAHEVVRAHMLACPSEPLPGWYVVGRAHLLLNNKIAWLKSFHAVQIGNSTTDLIYIPPKEQ